MPSVVQGDVGGCGGVHHLLRLAGVDPGVLVVFGQDGGVAGAQPQAGVLFPGGAEPDGLGEAGVAQGAGEQGHAAAVFHRLQLLGITGQDHLGAAGGRLAMTSARSGLEIMDASSSQEQVPGRSGTGPRAPRWPGRWPRNWAVL